ncbi:SEC-C metal-binding domain-containing protein [Amycolatopsis sp. NPDC059027]|uniref:SEC-C metal-binding domain-containing protein n=1 Tax=unclassified Amycolatopsis TaxID=2618356 RepID=UPI00366D7781
MVEAAADEARKFEDLAEQVPDERAQLLVEAAYQWSRAGDVQRAERLYLTAISDGGSVHGDARTAYADFLFEHEDADRAREVLAGLWASHPKDPDVYQSVGDLLIDQGDSPGALRWFTAGVIRCYGAVVGSRQLEGDPSLEQLLKSRSRVRKVSGETPDDWDRVWFERYERTHPGKKADQLWTYEHLAEMQQETARLQDENAILRTFRPGSLPETFPYWPRAEFDRALAAFPEVFAEWRDSEDPHLVHRRMVETALRAADAAFDLAVVPLNVDDVYAHAERTGVEPDSAETHQRLAMVSRVNGEGIAWPPGRNDPCWCGSARKYKKCCGTPGFTADSA